MVWQKVREESVIFTSSLLLDSLDIRGGTVTIDAMGCQKAIATKILEKEANYILAVKANQPTRMSEMKECFAWAGKDATESRQLAVYQEDERTRERRVIRQTAVSNEISWFEDRKEWAGLRTFVQTEHRSCAGKLLHSAQAGHGNAEKSWFWVYPEFCVNTKAA